VILHLIRCRAQADQYVETLRADSLTASPMRKAKRCGNSIAPAMP